MNWPHHAPATSALIPCAGTRHEVWWRAGTLVTESHDTDAELALTALGASAAGCVELITRWRAVRGDERVLRLTPRRFDDDTVLDRALFKQAVARPVRVAPREIEVHSMLTLPAPFQRRLASTVAAHLIEDFSEHELELEAALAGRAAPLLGAVLARAGCATPERPPVTDIVALAPGGAASVDHQPGSNEVRVALPVTWLLDVWGCDLGITEGDAFVLDGEGNTWAPATS